MNIHQEFTEWRCSSRAHAVVVTDHHDACGVAGLWSSNELAIGDANLGIAHHHDQKEIQRSLVAWEVETLETRGELCRAT